MFWDWPSTRRSSAELRLGVEVQVDCYVAYADLDGERIKLQNFSLRSMASGAAFHRAYPFVTTNLPFSEWPQVLTNVRLCKAVLDRLTD